MIAVLLNQPADRPFIVCSRTQCGKGGISMRSSHKILCQIFPNHVDLKLALITKQKNFLHESLFKTNTRKSTKFSFEFLMFFFKETVPPSLFIYGGFAESFCQVNTIL